MDVELTVIPSRAHQRPARAAIEHNEPAVRAPGADMLAAVRDRYARLDADIAAQNPVCTNRGDCCKFDAFGHRLYVTDVELQYFLHHQRDAGLRAVTNGTCPYQIDGRCTARDHRPLGCRIFFCDPNAQAWQPPLYEQYLADLKRIGRDHGIDYRYTEWLTALSEPRCFSEPRP